MKKQIAIYILLTLVISLTAGIPPGYYDSATGSGFTLKTQLYNIINGHNSHSYSSLWTHFQTTDDEDGYYENTGNVLDMYSENPDGSDPYNFSWTFDQCGTYGGEGDCYNREHSFPKSWFYDNSPMNSDLFHLYPTDGYVNGMRDNYPFGEVGTATWTSDNGSKLGTSSYPGYTGTVFEPIDEFKGDFARSYFYMATRYENVISSWSSDMLNGTSDSVFTSWALSLLQDWHEQDPVSQKEIDRNDDVYSIQNNRNPFIDHPEYVAQIWGGTGTNVPPYITNVNHSPASPNPTNTVSVSADISDTDGSITNANLDWGTISGSLTNSINMSSTSGNTYTTDSDMPSQSDGTTIYYRVSATDDSTETTTTSEYSYYVKTARDTLLWEDFTTCPATGWLTYDVAGSEDWVCDFSGFMVINAYGSDAVCDDWLITPALDLDSYSNDTLSFRSLTNYNDSGYPQLDLKYSTNYSGSGDPTSSTWFSLSCNWSSEDSNTWSSSGVVDISSISGSSTYFAFQYTSSGTGAGSSTLWQIDDFLVTGDSAAAASAPTATTNSAGSVTNNGAVLNGTVTANNASTTVTFKYGETTSYGSTATADESPVTGNTATSVSAAISGLSSETTYHYRVKAVNSEGTSYGSDETFTTTGSSGSSSDLYISEVSDDNTGGYMTAFMEIYNKTGSNVDIQNYYIERWQNNSYDSYTYTFSGSTIVPANGTLIVARGCSETDFETAWSVDFSDNDKNFDAGHDNLYFTTGRSYKFYDNAKAIVDTTPAVSSGNRRYQENIGSWTSESSSSTSTPASLDGGQVLPVTLNNFSAVYNNNQQLTLLWSTQSELANQGWFVYRAPSTNFGQAIRLNETIIPGAGTTNQPTDYSFTDTDELVVNSNYYYWLESLSQNGETELYGSYKVLYETNPDNPSAPNISEKYGLFANFPNPFNPSTQLSFQLKDDSKVKLSVYNVKGELVKILLNNEMVASNKYYNITWDGTNSQNKRVTSGVYLYNLETKMGTYTKKMILLK